MEMDDDIPPPEEYMKCQLIFQEPKKIYRKARGCDGNSTRKLCNLDCDLCFSRSFASSPYAYLWHESNKSARMVFLNSNTKFNFFCKVCNHIFVSAPINFRKSACPFCCIPSKRLCLEESCEFCYNKSLASVDFVDTWDPENDKTPRELLKGTSVKYKLICSKQKCGHTYEISIKKLVGGNGCPYCCNESRKLCPVKDCEKCRLSSFDNHSKKIYWSSKNEGKPKDYKMMSSKKFFFDCPKCGHEFDASLAHVTRDGRWCPYCIIPSKKVCEDEDCEKCYQKKQIAGQRKICQ
jgi:hypothetical protein